MITPYFKENNNTSYVMDSRVNGKQTLMLGTVDSNLVFKDTIAFFDKGLDPAQKSLGFNFANAHRVGDKIFAISFLLGGNYDTTGFRHIFSSYDIKTKTKFERELSKDLLYYINNIRFVNISDGILHSGYTDTTLSILKVGAAKNPKYMGKVSKINVDGNVEWTTFVPHPLPLSESFYGRVVASEDTIRKGYWVMAGSDDNDTIPIKLLFFNRKGKITKEALIKKKPIQQGQFPQNIFALSNGGLTGNYFYYDCSAQYDTCFKVFYFEKTLLDALFKTEVATVFLEENIFNLFPNPAVNNINIHFAEVINNATINIINSQGQTIRNYKLRNEQDLTIETSFLENGIYFACFYDDNNRFSCKKFVVNH